MSLNWKGTWDAAVVYNVDDVAYYNGSSFVALEGNANCPPVSPNIGTVWSPVAVKGETGTTGQPGVQGPAGVTGATGAQGAQGLPGATFTVTGPQGVPGAQGPQGVPGITIGVVGPQGPTGQQGLRGPTGATGAQGPQGLQGVQGIQGVPGPTGQTGQKGNTGQGLIWRGAWVSSYAYVVGDCVEYGEGAYTCLNPVSSSVPPNSDTTNWDLMFTSVQVNADWDATDGNAEILNKPNLATVATTGNYSDLIGKPPAPFTFNQGTPLSSWVILHNLETFPTIVIIDSSGNLVVGGVHYDSLNQVTLSFSGAFSGTAVLTT